RIIKVSSCVCVCRHSKHWTKAGKPSNVAALRLLKPSRSDNGHYVNCPALDFTGVFLHSCPAPASSITLSARQRKVAGIVRPRAFAVFRFMTSSNFMGSSTGRSAGGADGGQHHPNIARLAVIPAHSLEAL